MASQEGGPPVRRRALIFTGGDPEPPTAVADLGPVELCVAADSGIDHAQALGWRVDLAVGDFDSVSPTGLATARAAGARIVAHPPAKDETDLELALTAAREAGATDVTVIGGGGGRVDHFLANALLLASPRFAGLRIEARVGAARIVVVRDEVVLRGRPGELVSLLPATPDVTGVCTEGLLYPLHGDRLVLGSTRGVSNELAAPMARVALATGVILAVQPGVLGTHLLAARAAAEARS